MSEISNQTMFQTLPNNPQNEKKLKNKQNIKISWVASQVASDLMSWHNIAILSTQNSSTLDEPLSPDLTTLLMSF